MPEQFESRIINICVKNSRNSPAIATNFCLDLNHSDSQLVSPRLVQRFLSIEKTGTGITQPNPYKSRKIP
jgi:hypothetical protein